MAKVLVKNDLFKISKRLKKIDKNYFVVFNTKAKRFEVHNKFQPDTFCFCVQNKLDESVLYYAHKSSIKNHKSVFFEIENNNQKIAKKEEESLKDKSSYLLNSYVKYLDKKSNYDFSKSNLTKWV